MLNNSLCNWILKRLLNIAIVEEGKYREERGGKRESLPENTVKMRKPPYQSSQNVTAASNFAALSEAFVI